MRNFLVIGLSITFIFLGALVCEADPDMAALKIKNGVVDPQFLKMHESFLERAKQGPIDLLFLGDSITQGWLHSKVWKEYYGQYNVANFGIGGDGTQHVLWRIEHGELDGISPKVVVLLIGTNNVGSPALQIIRGVKKVVLEIHQKLPNSKLLLLGIFPRGSYVLDPETIKLRSTINTVNAALASLDDGVKTRYFYVGNKFLDSDGNIPKGIMPDGLHPNKNGYQRWAMAMQPLLKEMMNYAPRTN